MRTIVVSLLIVIAVVTSKYLDTVQRPDPEVRIDTLRSVTTAYDTVRVEITITSRAADTVYIKDVGPLTEADLVHLICAAAAEQTENPRLKLRGTRDEHFDYAPAGIVYCPER